jgi:hypothetical protein
MEGDTAGREVRVRGEPAWENPDCGRVAWFLEWADRWGRPRRLLYGFGPGARHTAQAVAERIAGAAEEVRPCAVVVAGPPKGDAATAVGDALAPGGE